MLGWAFKKDTNDTRESAAIYVAWELLQDHAEIHVYDPKVSKSQILRDLKYLATMTHSTYSGDFDSSPTGELEGASVHVHAEPYDAMKDAHAIAIMTEWDEFKTYDWQRIFENMIKPAFLFDGRNILDRAKLSEIGFNIKSVGKGTI